MVPVAILEFTLPLIYKDGTNHRLTYGFPVVKHEGKLFIALFNDPHVPIVRSLSESK